MWMISLVTLLPVSYTHLFDIDGTLVSFKTHKIPQSTVDALEQAKKNGVEV